MDEIVCTCTRCGETKPVSEFGKRRSKLGHRSSCLQCDRVATKMWRSENYDSSKTDFRQSPHIDSPNMRLRYHLCDPVKGELVATAATEHDARTAAIEYHNRRRVRIKFVEIFDEKTGEVYHLTRPTKRYARGVLRGPCKPVSPDESLRITRGPDKVPRGPRITVSTNTQSEGNNATTTDDSSDNMPLAAGDSGSG